MKTETKFGLCQIGKILDTSTIKLVIKYIEYIIISYINDYLFIQRFLIYVRFHYKIYF